MCTRTDTMHNNFIHSLYCRIVFFSFTSRKAVHLTTKRQILHLQTHTHTQNRSIQTTCWRHFTLHVTLQLNALNHVHVYSSLRTTRTHTNVPLPPRHLTTQNTRHRCRRLFDRCVLLGTIFYTTRENKSRYNSVLLWWVRV
jgi:hypothetical protein